MNAGVTLCLLNVHNVFPKAELNTLALPDVCACCGAFPHKVTSYCNFKLFFYRSWHRSSSLYATQQDVNGLDCDLKHSFEEIP